jgi:hypothetical protein
MSEHKKAGVLPPAFDGRPSLFLVNADTNGNTGEVLRAASVTALW